MSSGPTGSALLDAGARKDLLMSEPLVLLCEREIARKDERRVEMTMKIAHVAHARELDGFDFDAQPSTDPHWIRGLATAAGWRTATLS